MSIDKDLKKYVYKLVSKFVLGVDLYEQNGKVEERAVKEALRVQRIDFLENLRQFKGYVINESLIDKL